MKIAVLDDEKKAADIMCGYLNRYAEENMLDFDIIVYDCAERMLQDYDCSFRILFLDIEMSGMNGIQAAKHIRERDDSVAIVFVTNMAQYALQGYDVSAVDFILKPVTYEKFLLKIDKIFRRLDKVVDETLVLHTAGGIVNIPLQLIVYIEVNRNYLLYHTQSGTHRVRGTMSEAEKQVSGKSFSRISNSYIVNMKYITRISASTIAIGNKELAVSRLKKADFLQKYLRYMERV